MSRQIHRFIPGIMIALVALLSFAVVSVIYFNPANRQESSPASPYFTLEPEDVAEDEIFDYAGIRRTYTLSVPDSPAATNSGANLTIYLRHTLAEIRTEDSVLYDNTAPRPGISPTPGNYWITLPAGSEMAGKTVQVILTPVYRNVMKETPEFLLISRDTLLSTLVFPRDRLLMGLSQLAMFSGIVLAAVIVFLPLDKRHKRNVFCLSAVTFFAGLWKYCGLPIVPLLTNHLPITKALWFAGTVSYLLMLILSMRLMSTLREQPNHTARICFYISAGAASLFLILQLLGVLELHQVVIQFGVDMAFLHLVALIGRKPDRRELVWLFPFFLTLGADMLIYQLTGSMRSAPAFLIWIILNLFIRGFGFVRKAILDERKLRRQEAELHQAKLQSMMNQIRPHFIYNTLTSIYALCRDDPERAARVVSDFTDYLHANFSAVSATEMIPFSEELQHTQAYLAVESVLYGDRLTVNYDIQVPQFRLPPLTLQPIVENSVKYGVASGHAPGIITVRTRSADKGTEIIVEDNGPGFDPDVPVREGHVGLQNVRERLAWMCSGTIKIAPRREGGTIVTIFVPTAAGLPEAD